MLLGFEKAYDRISWPFMRSILEKQKFYPNFIKEVMALYENASSLVLVNGEIGENFDLSRLVHQNYPLAPFLFIVVFDTLGFMLANPQYGIQGLRLSNGKEVKDVSFVDNESLYLLGTVSGGALNVRGSQ